MRKERALILLSLAPVIYSMSEPAQIPSELKDVRVRITDSEGITHHLRGIRCSDGVLRLRRGALSYSVPLSTVKRITLVSSSDGEVRIRIEFRDGESEVFETSAATRCLSESDAGSVSFHMDEIREIEILQGEGR